MRDPDDEFEREPTLEDVLSDPDVQALMARDRVEADDLRGLAQRLRDGNTRRPPGEAKIAAAHEWMTSLHERGRSVGLRYPVRLSAEARAGNGQAAPIRSTLRLLRRHEAEDLVVGVGAHDSAAGRVLDPA